MKLSVIVPAYNEEDCLEAFCINLLGSVIDCVQESYEILIVNDGSRDNTLQIAQQLARHNKRIRVINLSRNFGKEIATTAGIFQANGEAIMMIDADGQHPPELIPRFIKLWEEGYQVIVGVRQSNQKEGVIKRYGSKVFYKIFNATSSTVLLPGATDFRLIDQVVRQEFVQFTERYRITRGLIDWMGFKRATVYFHAKERMGGKASYKVSGLLKLAINSFVSHSMAPLYAIGYAGLIITILSFAAGVFLFVEQLLLQDPFHLNVTGGAMLTILTVFLVGLVLMAQGLIAIYLSHIHIQTQNRPLFIIDKKNSVNLN